MVGILLRTVRSGTLSAATVGWGGVGTRAKDSAQSRTNPRKVDPWDGEPARLICCCSERDARLDMLGKQLVKLPGVTPGR